MTITFDNSVLNAAASGAATIFNSGSVEIFTTGFGTLLVTYTLEAVAFTLSATPGRYEIPSIIAASAVAAGDAADYRIKDSGGTPRITAIGEVSLVGGGGSLELNAGSLTLTNGQSVDMASLFITVS